MRRFFTILIVFFCSIMFIGLIYFHLPFEIQFKKQINTGNQLIEKIEEFRVQNDSIPEDEDWKILSPLGFDVNDALAAMYHKLNKTDYTVAYYWGFDPPYLYYYSKTRKWEYGVVPLEKK